MLALTLTADLTGFVKCPNRSVKVAPELMKEAYSVTNLLPVDTEENPQYYSFRVQCTSCRETHPNWVHLSRHVSFGQSWSRDIPTQPDSSPSGVSLCRRPHRVILEEKPEAHPQPCPSAYHRVCRTAQRFHHPFWQGWLTWNTVAPVTLEI